MFSMCSAVPPLSHLPLIPGTLFSASVGVSLLASPPVVAFCQSKSTRLAAVVGALVLALGVLFTSFAVEFSQLYCSFGTVIGEHKRRNQQLLRFVGLRK